MFLLLFYCQLLEILDTRDLILVVKSGRVSTPQDWDGDGSNSRPGQSGNGVPQRAHTEPGHCFPEEDTLDTTATSWISVSLHARAKHACALHVSLRLASACACVRVCWRQTAD